MTKKQYIILSLLSILLLASVFLVYNEIEKSIESQKRAASLQDASESGVATVASQNRESESDYNLTMKENLETFWPKLINCEVGESALYPFEAQIDMFGFEIYSYTKNKIDILSKEESKCKISVEALERNFEFVGMDELIEEGIEDLKLTLIDYEDFTEERAENLLNTKVAEISQEDKDILIKNDLTPDFFGGEYNDETFRERMHTMANASFQEEMNYEYEEMGPVKQVCTGEPDALIDFLNFTTSEDGSLSVSCSSNMICEYENGVECLQISNQSTNQSGYGDSSGNELALFEAKDVVEEYVNANLMPAGSTATVVGMSEEYDIYEFVIDIDNIETSSLTVYLTKDGKLLFRSVYDLEYIVGARKFTGENLSIEEIKELYTEHIIDKLIKFEIKSDGHLITLYDASLYRYVFNLVDGTEKETYITRNGAKFFHQVSHLNGGQNN